MKNKFTISFIVICLCWIGFLIFAYQNLPDFLFYLQSFLLLSSITLAVHFLFSYAIKAKEQIQFLTAFSIGLGGKILASLAFLCYQIFVIHQLSKTQVLIYFAMYFSYTAALLSPMMGKKKLG
jgi:hypothetical protein